METQHPRGLRSLLYLLFGVCPILFFTDLTRNPYYTQIALLNVLLPACWLLWLYEAWRTKEFVWVSTALDAPFGLLIALSIASWAASAWAHPGFVKSVYSEGSKAMVFLFVNTYLVYAAAVRIRDRALLKRLLLITYAVSVAAAVYGIAQYFGTEWIWPHSLNPYGSRPVSTFGNPNFMSSYLMMVMPVLLADFLFRVTPVPRFFVMLGFMACLGALLATLTRSSWAGFLIAMIIVSWGSLSSPGFKQKIKGSLVVAVILVALIVVFWPKNDNGPYSATVFGRLAEIKDWRHGQYAPVSQRFLIWTSAWEMVLERPFLGKGWGCFELFYPFYQGPLLLESIFRNFRTHANNAHNEILEYWSQMGTLGLGSIILLWIVFFRQSFSIRRRLEGPWKGLQLGLVAGVVGMLIDNLLNVSIHFAVPAFLFWWWVGSVFLLDPGAWRLSRFDLNKPGRAALAFIAALFLVGFMGRSVCLWAGEINFFKGFKLSKLGTELPSAAASLEAAYQWHHQEVNNDYELANVYARMGDQAKALQMYDKALYANPGYDEIYFNRATLLSQMGKFPEAIRDYRICLAINPLSQAAYNALGGLYFKSIPVYGADAEKLYQQGVSVFPNDKDLWNNLGYLYAQQQSWEAAYDAYRHTLEVDPEYDLVWRNLRAISSHLPSHADDAFLHVDEIFKQIDAQMEQRQWNDALENVHKIQAILPKSFRAHFDAGNIYYGMGRFAEAAGEYQAALERHSDASAVWQNLGATLARMGRKDDARLAWQKALQLKPDDPTLKALLK